MIPATGLTFNCERDIVKVFRRITLKRTSGLTSPPLVAIRTQRTISASLSVG